MALHLGEGFLRIEDHEAAAALQDLDFSKTSINSSVRN